MPAMFFGSREDEIHYYAKKGLDAPERPDEEKPKVEEVEVQVLDLATLDPITDAERRIIERTRCEHDPLTVYMQSDVQFYDIFYNNEEVATTPILKQVRSLRRVYRDYRKYKEAMRIRDEYLDYLLDTKYNGDSDLFETMVLGSSDPADWIPPKPIFNNTTGKSFADLERDLLNLDSLWTEPTEEQVRSVINYLQSKDSLKGEDISDVYTVPMADPDIVIGMEEVMSEIHDMEKEARKSNRRALTNVNTNVKDIIRSWYNTTSQDDEKKEDTSNFFYYSKDKILERYYAGMITYKPDPRIDEIMRNPDVDRETLMSNYDPSVMVYDKETSRPMTEKELNKREMVRMLGKCGWNELDMMKFFDVGTRFERSKLERKERKSEASRYKVTPETMALREQLKQRRNEDGFMTTNQTLSITNELDALLRGGIF